MTGRHHKRCGLRKGLRRLHQIKIVVWRDIERGQDLIEHRAVLSRHAETHIEILRPAAHM